MAQFSTPSKVRNVIEAQRQADQPRAWNRARINDLFNGLPPFSEEETRENRLQTNINFLEGANIAHSARRQLYNAFLKPGVYFHVAYDRGPAHMRRTWGRIITREINRDLKRSLPFTEAMRSTHAQIILHGVGPRLWHDKTSWCPYARGIEDVLTPSGTLVSMENLQHFTVYRQYTASELYRATHKKRTDPGWNVRVAERIIAALLKEPIMAANWTEWRFPEKLAENIKADYGYYGSDAVPTINCWDFYFQDEDPDKGWHRKLLLDSYNPTSGSEAVLSTVSNEAKEAFLYDPKDRIEAKELSEILHVQFADCSNVAPFRWHSVRSLGYLLYNVCHLQNRIRCRFTDAQQMELLWFFRNVPEEDREKLLQIQLYNMGIIPQGVDFVTGPERYHPDANLIALGLSQNRQLMAENSASFVQDVAREEGSSDETATLTMAKVNASSALISSMLNLAYIYETHLYREVARRFCTSIDPACVAFRKRCQEQGVVKECFDVEAWDIEPERVLGAGNKTLEIAQADRLMAVRAAYDPEAQRHILHIYTEANSDDPKLADLLVPLAEPEAQVSKSEHEANLAMGTLMLGLPVPVPREVSLSQYAETLVIQLQMLTQQIEESGGMVDEQQLRGLMNVDQYIQQLLQHLEADESERERVRAMQDSLGNSQNLIKAFAQRLQEQKQASQMDPEAMAKIQAIVMTAQVKAQETQASGAQRREQKQLAFEQKTRHTAIKNAQALEKTATQTGMDVRKTGAEMASEQARHTHQILMDQEAHEVELQRQRELAEVERKTAATKRNGDE